MNESSNTNSCVIELHYCLKDNSHSMDAFIFNECEREFLNIVREIIQKSGAEVEVEIEALGQGGLRSWIKFNASIMAREIIVGVIVANLCAPISATRDELISRAIEIISESKEVRELKEQEQIAELEYEIAEYKSKTKRLCQSTDNIEIGKCRSDFYVNLSSCNKVEKVIVSITDEKGGDCQFEEKIERSDFHKYIMPNKEIEPEYINDAIIEIISPVIKDRKYKWTGIYNNETIRFNMWDEDFKNRVRAGQISFNDDFSIICHLMIRRKIDNEGNVKIIGYEVTHVDNE